MTGIRFTNRLKNLMALSCLGLLVSILVIPNTLTKMFVVPNWWIYATAVLWVILTMSLGSRGEPSGYKLSFPVGIPVDILWGYRRPKTIVMLIWENGANRPILLEVSNSIFDKKIGEPEYSHTGFSTSGNFPIGKNLVFAMNSMGKIYFPKEADAEATSKF